MDGSTRRWTTRQTALAGAIAGAIVGYLVLKATEPTAEFTNDEYRGGASFGWVVRYAILGAIGAVLGARILHPDHGTRNSTILLYSAGLAVVLGVAVLPPVLDEESPSERRRAAAVRSGDPAQEFEAGAIDGCADSTRSRIAGTAAEGQLDPDAYCECFIPRLFADARGDEARMTAVAARIEAGHIPAHARRAGAICTQRAAR